MKNEAILDFKSEEWSDEMRDKLIDAIKNGKKVFPISVDFDCELDIARISLSMTDSGDTEPHFATINMNFTDFHCLVEENGYKVDIGEEEPTEEEKEQIIEDMKDSPFKDMLKEVSG